MPQIAQSRQHNKKHRKRPAGSKILKRHGQLYDHNGDHNVIGPYRSTPRFKEIPALVKELRAKELPLFPLAA